MGYEHGYAELKPDPLFLDSQQAQVRKPHKQSRPEHYFHVPVSYMKYVAGKGLTAAALILLLEAHRRVKVGFGPLPLTAHSGKAFGLKPREIRTAREQLQKRRCSLWTVHQEHPPKGAYLLAIDPAQWTDRSHTTDFKVSRD